MLAGRNSLSSVMNRGENEVKDGVTRYPNLLSQFVLVTLGTVDVDSSMRPRSIISLAVNVLCEKTRIAPTVLMRVFYDQITVNTSKDTVSTRFDADDIEVAVLYPDNHQLFADRRCHVFGVYEQLIFHSVHTKYTAAYGINCTCPQGSGGNYRSFCNEFPHSSRPVLQYIRFMRTSPVCPNTSAVLILCKVPLKKEDTQFEVSLI
ncbi:unnamed protein product [Enterobius vermicularis]|uniref:Piwi domain-containing protein n=1 Tax=Enterobius vermicularis TaxID=51028 RepID=A0A0N4UYS8_ENTVE|nr:unnamed protein product [Enterobius vermicularis]